MTMTTPPPHSGGRHEPGIPSSDERLAFNYGPGPVTVERHVPEAVAAGRATAAIAPSAESSDWGYLGALAFTAVLLLRPQDQIRSLDVLHLAQVCATIGVGAMLMRRFTRRLPLFKITPEIVGLMALGFVMLATAPFSIWPGGAVQEFVGAYLKFVVIFVLLVSTLTSPKRLEQLTWLIVLCCGYIALRAVFDYARGVNLVEDGRVAGAVGGIFGNSNDLAMNMVTFMPAALIVALTPRHSALRRLTAAAIAALMLATVIFTKSRGGALGLAVMLIAFIFLARLFRPGFMVAALAAVLLITPFVPASFWTRMATIVDEQEDKTHFTGSSEARRILLEDALNTFLEHPLTGVGAGQFRNYNPEGRKVRFRETHNALLQVAADTGIFGLAAFSFLIGCGAIAAVRARRWLSKPRKRHAVDRLRLTMSDGDRRWLHAYVSAMAAGLIGWFVCAMFASIAFSWTFYYLLALIVATRDLVGARLTSARAIETGIARADVRPSERLSPEKEKGATWTPQTA
jgi:O-antigen ligase